MRASWLRIAWWLDLLAIWLCCALAFAEDEDLSVDDAWTFRTRPDIGAPRFRVVLYNETALAPGYWFIASYDYLDQSLATGGHWTAPQIYDASGGLVWSGSYLSKQYNSFDFRMSNVLGEQMMTWMYPQNRTALVMDTRYDIRDVFQISNPETQLDNMHDLHFVDDGTRVLYFYAETKALSTNLSEYIGYADGNCYVRDNSFAERDMATGEIVFTWSPSEHIDLKDSTFTNNMQKGCEKVADSGKGWDFIHANSIDKFPDGSGYLLSGRHTDTIYKIHPDKSIAWRLGGRSDDFDSDFEFARQHHARIHEHNATHTVISFFDNSRSEDGEIKVARYSRGVLVALQYDVTPMKATLLAKYPHPDRFYTLGRGSAQVLPNNNMFMCWVDACLLSEHDREGRILMEARSKQEWLKTYRAYKFDFKGFPSQPPDALAEVSKPDGSTVRTQVFVSWNGATEVATWRLYKTTADGKRKTHLFSMPRQAFETIFDFEGYSKFLVVEALDRNYKSLGESKVLETRQLVSLAENTIADEEQWLQSQSGDVDESLLEKAKAVSSVPLAKVALWIVLVILVLISGRFFWQLKGKNVRLWRRRSQSYKLLNLAADDGDGEVERFILEEGSDDDDDAEAVG